MINGSDEGASLFQLGFQFLGSGHAGGFDVSSDGVSPVSVQPLPETLADVGVGLLPCLGDVDGDGDTPSAAVDALAVCLSCLFGVAPLLSEVDGRDARLCSAEGHRADAVGSGDLHAVWRCAA